MRRTHRLDFVVRCLAIFLVLVNGFVAPILASDPTGGVVVAGSAAIHQNGSALNVVQQSNRAIIDWNSFSIAHGHSANFQLPNATSAVLNRVTSANNPSVIAGSIQSNGNVYLVNPSGVLIGPSGAINTNGFTASTLDISNAEFMRGGALQFRGNSKASVVNQGTITTGAGGAQLIGNQVVNQGTITSQGGSVALAAGHSVQLQGGGSYIQADAATIQNGISEFAPVIQNSGTIRAVGAAQVGGQVYLVNPNGNILHDGTIQAQQQIAANQNQVTGGKVTIDTGSGQAKVAGQIDVTGQSGGRVTVTGSQVALASATIDASGKEHGGEVLIGGGFQGRDSSVVNALATTVDATSVIRADSQQSGDAGQVIVWSDRNTNYAGTIYARALGLSGNGGFAEVSGKENLRFDGNVSLVSVAGQAGQLLLDPRDIIIGDSGTENSQLTTDRQILVADTIAGPPPKQDFNISNTTLQTLLSSSGGVTLQASRDVIFDRPVIYSSLSPLHVLAGRNIELNAHLQNNSGGNIFLVAGWDQTSFFLPSTFTNANVTSTTLFGNGSGMSQAGSVFVGKASQTISTAVGSRAGLTAIYAKDLVLNGGSGAGAFAQLGYNRSAVIAANPAYVMPPLVVTTGSLQVHVTRDLILNAGSGAGAFAQIGHRANGSFLQEYRGPIETIMGRDLKLTGADFVDRYAVIGHGTNPGTNGTDYVTSDIMIRAGRNADLTWGVLGNLTNPFSNQTNPFAAGMSNKTFIEVGRNNPTTPGSGTLTADANSRFISSTNGQLRFYMPGRSSYQIAAGAQLNGTTAVAPGTSPLPNEHGVYSFGNGPYIPITAEGNFAIYVGKTLLWFSSTGSSEYGSTPGPATYTLLAGTLSPGDTVASIGLTDDHATVVTPTTPVGTHQFQLLSTNLKSDYKIHPESPTTWTVTPAPLSIIANDRSKTYGNTLVLGTTRFTSTGLKNGESIGGVTLTSNGAAPTASVTSDPYPIVASAPTGGTFNPNNYDISFVDGKLTVNKAPLRIGALPQLKTYGDSFTFNGSEFFSLGLKNGETIGQVTLNSAATSPTANVGLYGITPSNPTGGTFALGNYNVTFLPSVFGVAPALLNIKPLHQNKTYGDSFTFNGTEFVATGLKNNETIGSVTLASAATSPTASVAGSPYVITASNATGGTFNPHNYIVRYSNGQFVVSPAPLSIAALNQSKTYGDSFTFNGQEFQATGLKNNETIGSVVLSSAATAPTANVAGSPYSIAISGPTGGTFNPNNYVISLVNGQFVVNKAPLAIIAKNQLKDFGSSFTFNGTEFSSIGLKNGETIDAVTLASFATNEAAPAGYYAILPSAPTGSRFNVTNYAPVFVPGTFIVGNPLGLFAYDLNDRARLYWETLPSLFLGNNDPVPSFTFSDSGKSNDGRMAGMNSFDVFGSP